MSELLNQIELEASLRAKSMKLHVPYFDHKDTVLTIKVRLISVEPLTYATLCRLSRDSKGSAFWFHSDSPMIVPVPFETVVVEEDWETIERTSGAPVDI